MQIIDNFISLEELKKIKEFYQPQQFYFSSPIYFSSPLASWIIKEILHDKIQKLFGHYTISPHSDVYQRFTGPVKIHNDSKQKITQDLVEISQQPEFSYVADNIFTNYQNEGQVLLIPFDQGTELNTVVWKEKCTGKTDSKILYQMFKHLTLNTGISKLYNLSHTYDITGKRWCDYLALDAIFNWKLGSAVIWDRNQLHCATDFTAYCSHKDAICIMFE